MVLFLMINELSKTLKEIENFKRQKLKELYNMCTIPQQKFFNKMYGSLDDVPEENINWAIQQCERTIEKNKKKE